MFNVCGIVASILKMATRRNCSMSGINFGHHYLPTYQILMMSDNVEFLPYCGGHFENGDRQKFFNVRNQFGHHYLSTYQILMISDNVEFLPPIFYAVFWQTDILKILKTHNCSSNGDLITMSNFMSISLSIQKLSTLMYEISSFPQDSIVIPNPFEPLNIWPLPQI